MMNKTKLLILLFITGIMQAQDRPATGKAPIVNLKKSKPSFGKWSKKWWLKITITKVTYNLTLDNPLRKETKGSDQLGSSNRRAGPKSLR
jgi:hypothetical protein